MRAVRFVRVCSGEPTEVCVCVRLVSATLPSFSVVLLSVFLFLGCIYWSLLARGEFEKEWHVLDNAAF